MFHEIHDKFFWLHTPQSLVLVENQVVVSKQLPVQGQQ